MVIKNISQVTKMEILASVIAANQNLGWGKGFEQWTTLGGGSGCLDYNLPVSPEFFCNLRSGDKIKIIVEKLSE